MRTSPPMISVEGSAKASAIARIQPGSGRQSASTKAMTAPRAAAAPRLRAGPGPGVASESSRTPGKRRHASVGGASEPLSTTMTSKLVPSPVCAASAASTPSRASWSL